MLSMFNESEILGFGENKIEKTSPNQIISAEENNIIAISLQNLISSMKNSFLQKNNQTIKQVFLCDSKHKNPMFLINSFDENLIIGTGFYSTIFAWKKYDFCPDLRLLFSANHNYWIILEDLDNLKIFLWILEALNFPIVWTNEKNFKKIWDFSDENIRKKLKINLINFEKNLRIGDFEINFDKNNTKILEIFNQKFFLKYNLDKNFNQISTKNTIFCDENFYYFNEQKFVKWEILELNKQNFTKNFFKFSFDDIFLDGKSFGISSDNILQDRKKLSDGGIIFINLNESEEFHSIFGKIFVESMGFCHFYEKNFLHKNIAKKTRQIYEAILLDIKNISHENLQETLKNRIEDFVLELTGKNPLIIIKINSKNIY